MSLRIEWQVAMQVSCIQSFWSTNQLFWAAFPRLEETYGSARQRDEKWVRKNSIFLFFKNGSAPKREMLWRHPTGNHQGESKAILFGLVSNWAILFKYSKCWDWKSNGRKDKNVCKWYFSGSGGSRPGPVCGAPWLGVEEGAGHGLLGTLGHRKRWPAPTQCCCSVLLLSAAQCYSVLLSAAQCCCSDTLAAAAAFLLLK